MNSPHDHHDSLTDPLPAGFQLPYLACAQRGLQLDAAEAPSSTQLPRPAPVWNSPTDPFHAHTRATATRVFCPPPISLACSPSCSCALLPQSRPLPTLCPFPLPACTDCFPALPPHAMLPLCMHVSLVPPPTATNPTRGSSRTVMSYNLRPAHHTQWQLHTWDNGWGQARQQAVSVEQVCCLMHLALHAITRGLLLHIRAGCPGHGRERAYCCCSRRAQKGVPASQPAASSCLTVRRTATTPRLR